MRVLVVEDNPTQSTFARISLQRRGLDVNCASTLKEAVGHLTSESIDVILLDLSLPDSNGIDTFYKVRQVAANIPTVVFTGLDDQDVAIEALKNGAQDYLIKGLAGDDSVFRCLQYAIERNKVEAALRKSERRLRIILEHSYDAFASMDTRFHITDWNNSAERTFGITKPEALGRSLAIIAPHHLRKQYARDFDEFFDASDGRILRMTTEMMAQHKDGHEFPIEIVVFRIYEDESYMYCAFARDITERKQAAEVLERRVQERTAELTQSNEELRQFAKIASHDLQEPLRAVQGFANLLQESTRDKLDQDSLEFIDFILDGTARMQSLIQSVLLHSNIPNKEDAEEVDIATDCNSVIEEVLANLDATIKDNHAKLEVDNLPVVAVSRLQLIQLFQNIVSNGLKYRGEAAPQIFITAEKTVNEWLFSIRDNGIGIDPKYADKIFDMFARLHGKTKYSGTGMGLAICKKIVNSHGGKIWVESEVGQGCIFLFTLPAGKTKESGNGK
ncbi:MAG TPA: ATP-binding protein [Drouetiella sp.]